MRLWERMVGGGVRKEQGCQVMVEWFNQFAHKSNETHNYRDRRAKQNSTGNSKGSSLETRWLYWAIKLCSTKEGIYSSFGNPEVRLKQWFSPEVILYHSWPQDTGQGLETVLVVRTGCGHPDGGGQGHCWTPSPHRTIQPQKSTLAR